MSEEPDISQITENSIKFDEDSNKLKEEINELVEDSVSLIDKIIENMNYIKKEFEKKKKLINNIPKEEMQNFLKNEKEYKLNIKNFYELSNNLKNSNKTEKKFSSSHPQFSITSKLEQENEDFIEMIKINNSKVAIRSDNSIIIEDISEKKKNKNLFKPSFGEKKIIYFCSYQNENVLVSLKSKTNQYFIELIDLEKEMNYELSNFHNEISYITISTNVNTFYVIEKPNILISFKNQNIDNKVVVEETKEIDSIIEINYNVLFCVNEYEYFIYDIENKKIDKKKMFTKKFKPSNIGHIQNFIIISRAEYFYFIEMETFKIVSKVTFPFEKCYFCDNAPFICLVKNTKISIHEFVPDLKNLLLRQERDYHEESIINSIIFNGPDKLLLFANGTIIQTLYLI